MSIKINPTLRIVLIVVGILLLTGLAIWGLGWLGSGLLVLGGPLLKSEGEKWLAVQEERRAQQRALERLAEDQRAMEALRYQQEQQKLQQEEKDRINAGLRALAKQQEHAVKEAQEKVNGLSSQADIDRAIDHALDRAEDDLKGQSGRVVPGILGGLLLTLCVATVATPAPTSQPTTASKARAARVIATLNKQRLLIRHLRKRLKQQQVDLKKHVAAARVHERRLAAIECRRQVGQAQAEVQACHKQQRILIGRRCPPCWPSAVLSGVSVAVVCGGVILGRELSR